MNHTKLDYDSILKSQIELEEAKVALEAYRNKFIRGKIRNLGAIGRSVYWKMTSNGDNLHMQKEDLLGDFKWILNHEFISIDSIDADSINITTKYNKTKFSIPRSFLHISDRDFAKMVREQTKKSQRDFPLIMQAQLEVKEAENKLEDAKARLRNLRR